MHPELNAEKLTVEDLFAAFADFEEHQPVMDAIMMETILDGLSDSSQPT